MPIALLRLFRGLEAVSGAPQAGLPHAFKAGRDGCRLCGSAELIEVHTLPPFVFHELRHTAAALAIAAGALPLAIKERLGHSSITVTMDRYGGLFPRLDEAIAQGLDGVLRDSLAASVRPDTAEVVRFRR